MFITTGSTTTEGNESGDEYVIVTVLLEKLSRVAEAKLGYAATGLNELETPAILVQLESLTEVTRMGDKARFELQFIVSGVVPSSEQTTIELISLTRQIRTALNPAQRLCPEARKHTLSDTRFDIAPNHGQLSFADSTLTIEAIL